MKITKTIWYKGKKTRETLNLKPYKSNKDCVLLSVPVEGYYFNDDAPITGAFNPACSKKWYPHITVSITKHGPNPIKKLLEVEFPYIYGDVYACSTFKEVINICLLKKV